MRLRLRNPALLAATQQAAPTGSYELAMFSPGNYGRRSTTLNAIADGVAFTLSFRIRFLADDGVSQTIFSISNGTAPKLKVSKNTSNQIEVACYSTGGTLVLNFRSTSSITVSSGWVHCLMTSDSLTSRTNHRLYINGTNEYTAIGSLTNTAIDMAPSSPRLSVGVNEATASPTTAEIAEMWFDDSYLDNLSGFYNGSSYVDLGSDGSTPLGSAPAIYYSRNGSFNNWVIDSSGNGNDLTITGTLGVGDTYQIKENCEGTGKPSNFTDSGSTNWDYTTTVLEGSQSLRLSASASTSAPIGSWTTGWIFFLYNMSSLPASTTSIGGFRASDTSARCVARVNTTGNLGVFANGADSPSFTTQAMSTNTTYGVWVQWNASGTCSAAFAPVTSLVRPTGGTDYYVFKTGGTGVSGLLALASSAATFDKIRASPATIGDDPV